MKWIDTSDLELWASKPASKSDLPLLVSRLIRSTSTKITALSIPKGKSTNRGGWDGIVMASEGTEFVPEGISLWEFGTTGNALKKAEEDYTKRTDDPLGQDIASATFIFVTPQPWEKANEWIEEKKKEKKWKDIKVYNGNKLEEWLSIAPMQGLWLAKEIGRAPSDGFESAEDFWENWKVGPEYILYPELLTTGRENESALLIETLKGQADIVTVQASSIDEAIAFTVASIMQLETELQEDLLSRTVIVENEQSLKSLINNNDELVIIAKLDSSNSIHRAVTKGHFVILPLAPDDDYTSNKSLSLPRLNREGFNSALLKSGLDRERIESLRKESGRSITTLRRLEKFDFEKPLWASAENVRDIIPALLVGKWDETKEEDKQVIALVANEPYDSYITKLSKWKHTKDSPIYQIGHKWRISSPLDVWAHVAKHLTASDVKYFRQAFLKVTQHVKPSLSLEPHQRLMASFYHKGNIYSAAVREGLIQSLILIAVYGDKFKMTTQSGGQAFADSLIRSTFENANEDLWCSLNDVMPLIAEASPTSFLTAVEKSFEGEVPVIAAVFTEVNGIVTPTSYHTGLLWALESLAWMPDNLSRVTLILARLDMLDPGGTLSNRPSNTLLQIFLPWHPQTFATLEQRIEVLKKLSTEYSESAWRLLVKLLPHPLGGVAFQNHRCRWRLYNYQAANITYQELEQAYTEILTMCLSLAGVDADKIVKLLKDADASQADTPRILAHVKNLVNQIDDTENKIWNDLRNTLSQHRSMPTADWALSEEDLVPFVELYDLFKPALVVDQNKWLFQDHWPRFIEGGEFDSIDRHDFILKKRIEALKAINDEVGLDGIISLLPSVIPNAVGEAFASLLHNEEAFHEIFILLSGDDKFKNEMLQAVIYQIHALKGFDWIKRLYLKLQSNSEPDQLAALLIPLYQLREVIDFLSTTGKGVQDLYWKLVNPRFGDLDASYKELGLLKLIEANRHSDALQQLSYFPKDISSEKIFFVLDASKLSPDMPYMDPYAITRIFKELDTKGGITDDAMVQLELNYLWHLTSHGSQRKPRVIHSDLATNPESFVELLKWLYFPDNEEQKELEMEERQKNPGLGEAGYKLLSTWKSIPGKVGESDIDYAELNKWIDDVREKAAQAFRLGVADMEIAKILVRTKKKYEGDIWPPDEVCEIVDRIDTESIRNNFGTEILNSRGMTGRGVFEGGDQERELAKQYRTSAQKHAIKWPVTSSILERLANDYEIRGKEEDQQALNTDLDH